MKTKLLLLTTIILLSLFTTCKDKNSNPCKPQEYSYHTIADEAKSKIPYLKPEFDTISYASNKGDTLVFVRQPKDSNWYCTNHYPNLDCLPDYDCYENYGFKYTTIKGNGIFEFKHGKALYIIFNDHSKVDDIYYDEIEIIFNNFHFLSADWKIDNTKYQYYIGDTAIDNIIFKSVFYIPNELDRLDVGKGLFCKDFGLIQVQDKISMINWTLIKP